MHLSKLTIEGYKNFGQRFEIDLAKGLNVLVGENGVGKTAMIDAVRSLIPEDDFRSPISETDFFCPFTEQGKRSDSFLIHGKFENLSKTDVVAFLPWTDIEGNATLTLQVDNKTNNKGRYKPLLWGGASRSSMFEKELFDAIDCVYLPPLRDAEAKLREGKSSRLARLLKNLNKQSIQDARDRGELHRLEEKVKDFNESLSKDDEGISEASNLIKKSLREAIGDVFGQDTHIQFSETNFNRIVESLRLFFFPEMGADVPIEAFRSLKENSLGYNNLLYIATILAELTLKENTDFYKVLLIEEPEAHLHPQLQVRLLKYLEKTAAENNVQVVVTTHSPVLAASVSIDSLIHLSRRKTDSQYTYTAVPLKSCGLAKSSDFVNRWIDVTKSTLLFAKGVILVEGIAEAMLLPEFAKIILSEYNKGKDENDKLPDSLEDGGTSVINMNGIYFMHFMKLFCNLIDVCKSNIPIRCAGLTDKDPKPVEFSKPIPSNAENFESANHALGLIGKVNRSENARLFDGPLKTFEYDLAMQCDNRFVMLDVLLKLWPSKTEDAGVKKELSDFRQNEIESDSDKADVAFGILNRINDSKIGKGLFAQALADDLKPKKNADGILEFPVSFVVPKYIRYAVIWACGGDPGDA